MATKNGKEVKASNIIISEEFQRVKTQITYERFLRSQIDKTAIYVISGPAGCGKTTFTQTSLMPLFDRSLRVTLSPDFDESTSRGSWRYGTDSEGKISLRFDLSRIMTFMREGTPKERKLLVVDEGHLPVRCKEFWDSLRSITEGIVENNVEVTSIPIQGYLTLVILMNEPDGKIIFAPPFIDRLTRTFWVGQPDILTLFSLCGEFAKTAEHCPQCLKDTDFIEKAVSILSASVANTFGFPLSLRGLQAFWRNLDTLGYEYGSSYSHRRILTEAVRISFGDQARHFSGGTQKEIDYETFIEQFYE